MSDERAFDLINDPLTDNRDVSDFALSQGIGSGMIAAAEGVLSAAREAGRIDAERVLEAVIDLLRAAAPAK
jgi:hypothetical protein